MRDGTKQGVRAAVVLAAALVWGGCGASLDDEAINTAADAVEGTSELNAFLSVAADPAGAMTTADAAAMASGAGATARFFPVGCVTTMAQGATVSYRFSGCTGPYGLVNVNGTLQATFSARTANGWTVALTGDLSLNRSRVRPNAEARVRYEGANRIAEVTVMGGGTGPRGVSYENSGSYTSSWDGACFGLDGSIITAANGGRLTTSVSAYRRCRNECPQAGGSLSFTSSAGDTLRMVYRGGATAEVTGPRGATRTVALFCGR
jgi:hypothetical protein